MHPIDRYWSLAKPPLAAAVGCVTLVAGVGAVTGRGLVFVVDALFVLAVGICVLAVILTRPTNMRRRTVREAKAADESQPSDRGPDDERSGDPAGQLRTGLQLGVLAAALLCSSVLIQYGVLS